MTDKADLIVVGGGPAGSTLAGFVKKYAPGRRVVLLERCPGPRHHIGESLLPGIVPILKELGAFEKIDAAGFPRKIGANYVWGADREVWENDFNDVNVSEMLARGGIPEKIESAWQVRRSEYDEILLKHAESLGVEVVRGATAEGILEAGGAIEGLRWKAADGSSRETRGLVADCSGQKSFLSRFRRIREYNHDMRNIAGYAYYKGARWKYEYSGHPDKTKIFICSTGAGWFWYIPIARDVVSVGLVTSVERLRELGGDLRSVYERELAGCSEIAPLLSGAAKIEDMEGTGKSFFQENDWSYMNVAASGAGWLAAGDAAVFVDPILSTGVTLAHMAAHRAAYTILSDWEAQGEAERGALWADYGRYCRESAAQFLALALFWYGNERTTGGWWGRAREIQRAILPADLGDHEAFVAVSAGLTRHYERLLSTLDLLDEQITRPEEFPFYMSVLKGQAASPGLPSGDDRPALLHERVTEIVYHPRAGEGVLRPVKRARFLKRPAGDSLADALNPRRFVTRWHLDLLDALDGERTFDEARAAAAAKGAPAWWLEGRAPVFLRELRLQGVLSWEPAGAAAGGRA